MRMRRAYLSVLLIKHTLCMMHASVVQKPPLQVSCAACTFTGQSCLQLCLQMSNIPECANEQAKETLAQQQPPEVRILKHLLSIQSPQERQTALQDAFAPGADLQTEEQDLLST